MTRFRLLYVAPTLLLLGLAVSPLIRGSGTLYTRDVLTSHYPLKAAQAEALRRGELPLIDPYRAGGQPLLGNPNALPLYPDNLLYLVASPLWALNAHFWLHLLLAPIGFYWLGRAWGLRRAAAWAGGVCYVASGFFLSLLNLYNLVAGAALAPAFIAACLAARGESQPHARARDFSSDQGAKPQSYWSILRIWQHRAGGKDPLVARPDFCHGLLEAWGGGGDPDGETVQHPGRRAAAAGGLWALLLLAGDPMFAALSLLLAIGAVIAREPRLASWRAAAARLVAALGCGTLLAAPMLIEFVRILPLSYRGYWQFSIRAALAQSWDPRSALEWLLPFFFGRPDFTFWGSRFYGGNPPFFYSLFPGILCLCLIVLGGRPRRRAAVWAWAATGAGLFFAAGAWNPIVRLLYHLPGASALRYPVKLWLAVAIGCSLLCALGFERFLEIGRRRLARIMAAAAVCYLAVWALLLWSPSWIVAALRALDPQRLNEATLARETARWSALCFFSLVTLALFALALAVAREHRPAGGAALLAVHLLSQGLFLAPLFDADDAERYTQPPALLDSVPEDSVVVHGGFRDLFGRQTISPLTAFPDPRFFWLARRQAAQLYPFAGVPWGRRYELNHSPEGLDSFFSVSLAQAIQGMDDAQRLRLLAASGVGTLILDRELAPEAAELARLVSFASLRGDSTTEPDPIPGRPGVFVYRLLATAPPVGLPGTVLRAPQMNRALEILSAPEYDPRTAVVLPGDEPEARAAAGRVEVLAERVEELEVTASSEAGGVLLTQRAYLDLYRATIDGRPAPTVVANLHRLAVEVPPGEHRVRLWIDRRPTRVGWLAALLGVAGLAVMAIHWQRTGAPS